MSCHYNELIMERLFEEGLDKGLNDKEALIYANEQFEQLLWIKTVNQDQVIKINSMRILTKSFVKQRLKRNLDEYPVVLMIRNMGSYW